MKKLIAGMAMSRFNIKKLNIPLIIGIAIIAALIMFSIYPEIFTPSDPYGKERQEFVFIDGKINLFSPPVEPCAEYPWGTDVYGRDMRSLIFYGCRLTLLTAIFIAFGRLLISLPLAILAGYRNKLAVWVMRQFSIMFSAFPLIIFTLLFTRIKLVADVFKEPTSIVAYILIIFGWSRLSNLLKEKVEGILSQDFIEGEIAIGKNRLEIALQNIIPHLIPTIVVLFFLEIAQALLILSQIGVFGLIVSGGIVNGDGDYRMPFEIDWASLLMASQWFISTGKYWLVLYPAAAFSVSIIGFNLLGEGLRLEFDKRSSRIISWIRGIPGFLSPIKLIYEIRHIDTYRRSVRRKLLFYTVILVIAFFPQGGSLYKFNTVNAFSTISELSKPEYEGRKAGSGKNEIIANYIADKLKGYGIQPFDGNYFHEFDMETAFNVKNSTMTVVGEASGSAALEFRKDYFITTPANINGTYELTYVTPKEVGLYMYSRNAFDHLRNKVLLADVRGLDGIAFKRFVGVINNIVKPQALIYISDWESEKVIKKETVDRNAANDKATLNISLSSDKGDELLRKANSKITLNIECELFNNPKSTSVVGYIPGSDKSLKDEIIFVGSSFDSVGDDENIKYPSSMEAGGTALELEIARVIGSSKKRPERTVIFAFWDGTLTRDSGCMIFLEKYFKEEYKKAFYVDLKNFGFEQSDKVIIDTTNTLPKEYLAQKYIKALKKHARRNEVKVIYGKIGSPITQYTLESDINSIIIDSEGIEEDIKTANDNLDNIDRGKLKGPGQMIVDTVYDIVCGGIR
ncbi:MAG TPA: M28 family peptidase [Clostridia bacterium]|nr:M28 family peptidase [Clostridia bacterium]